MASPPLRVAAATLLAFAASLTMTGAHAAPSSTSTVRWSSTAEFAAGSTNGLKVNGGSMALSKPTGTYSYADPYGTGKKRSYSYGTWDSPWTTTNFAARTLIPSWSVNTPSGTWIRVQMRGRSGSTTGSWDTIAYWSATDSGVHRASSTAQTDDLTKVDVDTVVANGSKRFSSWQVRVLLARPATWTSTTPTVWSIGGVAASYLTRSATVSKTTMTKNTELKVPRSSQMIHKGEYPQWGGGGASWCSPTSVAMVLRYFKTGPKPADYSWSKYPDSFVVHAARHTYDYRYDAAGNWPFNTAYAGRYGLDAFVTRLDNLRDAEAFIKKGIPVVASVRYAKGALTGSAVASSNGHLLVIVGVLKDGRVVVNDPAASSNSTVRRVYQRSQFEKAWLGGSGGVSYVIRPTSKPLPADTARW